jgi:acyl-CoA thioesterase
MPPVLTQRLGPNHEPFFAPSLDLTIHFLEDTTSQWLMTHVHTRRARAGFATGDVEVWDDAGRLVAVAIQMMMIRRAPGGEPLRDV